MLRALLFDMDGVLIDSEPLWHRAEIAAFGEAGLTLTAGDCLRTTGLRVDETVAYWCERFPALAPSRDALVVDILERLVRLVREEGEAKPGVADALAFAQRAGLRLALASSSTYAVIEAVTARLGLASVFEVIHSAEEEERGKPDPAVYLTTARKLGVDPADCVAVEDSPNGLLSAKAAGMRCLAIPEPALRGDPRFELADAVLSGLGEIGEDVWERLTELDARRPDKMTAGGFPMSAPEDLVLAFCRSLPGVTEDVKWDNDLVFSVGGKMFVVFGLPDNEPFSFKVHPAVFGTLTQQEGIRPAPYLAQHSWVSVDSRDHLPDDELTAFLRESYDLVAQKLSKKMRERLGITAY